ncbi:Uncharacterised protein [Mycobacteroides abscessus subsp. massiliense]|uniref:Acb2/Tad1 domain-containing protein n=1 Tax=Mycobacteroides abscessus TaxID=36809 RepID=UPI0009D17A2F|nr:hypothetical protein [Mycobacteroides abscessus]SKM81285.1 Uncharacterised protein [Mycobacteroides abscessus subsp. massiliense]SKM97719.1 Uncharacterised protein [Mycobacteroides abscessus subsp. massiliense]SKN76698.1 Uncharacterised protein [Mycobacteroides abscessus subsp. massiliense]SKN96423.1 Uncharacterised protein [Mycobacteroides abscessus subsp. massiliense]SKO21532.1 Uncharacterised protein [Mycobacteroides abscessus subsp. massiliense]
MPVIDAHMQMAIAESGIAVTFHTWLQGDPVVFHNTPASTADINNRFDYHRPSDAKVQVHEAVRTGASALAHQLDAVLPPGREKALAMTKLEEALMWANAAIARTPEDSL